MATSAARGWAGMRHRRGMTNDAQAAIAAVLVGGTAIASAASERRDVRDAHDRGSLSPTP